MERTMGYGVMHGDGTWFIPGPKPKQVAIDDAEHGTFAPKQMFLVKLVAVDILYGKSD